MPDLIRHLYLFSVFEIAGQARNDVKIILFDQPHNKNTFTENRMKRVKILAVSFLLLIGSIFLDSAFSDSVTTEGGNTVYTDNLPKLEKSYIEGTITDSTSTTRQPKPISGATVEFKNSNRGVGYYKTTTDRNGYYKIDDFIPYIRYDIEITAPGYVSYTETASLSRVKNDIRLTPESIITGTIKDSSGKTLSDVEVKVSRNYYYNSLCTTQDLLNPTITETIK